MKAIINSLKRTHWFKLSIVLIGCLLLLTFPPSCQKDEGNLPDFRSISGTNMITTPATSDDVPVLYYGHKIFTRVQGNPFVETQNIENPDFELFDNNFVLIIHNGDNKMTRVSSAEIKIDGVIVASPSDFSKNVSLITKQLTGLTAESILEVKLYSAPGSFIDLWIEGTLKEITLTDIDGNIYKTVKIGTQWWMAENLKTTSLNDGTGITLNTDDRIWRELLIPAYCWYNNDESTYKILYGALYNWYAVSTGKLCPSGWHVPTNADWEMLQNYLSSNGYNFDGSTVGQSVAKSMGSTYGWNPTTRVGAIGNTDYPDKRNASGFTGLPGGFHFIALGPASRAGMNGYWWSATLIDDANAMYRMLDFENISLMTMEGRKGYGCSVRCLKD